MKSLCARSNRGDCVASGIAEFAAFLCVIHPPSVKSIKRIVVEGNQIAGIHAYIHKHGASFHYSDQEYIYEINLLFLSPQLKLLFH